jgi:amino acid adenylation domain-containing protein
LTAERFAPHPFSSEPGARLYRTGDLGWYRADGEIEFLGRRDHQVKVRGYRIELGEIGSALRELEDVDDVVAVVREDVAGDKRLVAYVAPSAGRSLSNRELREHLERRLPEYMAPSAYVILERLPLTPNGKLDHRALPAPDMRRAEEGGGYLASRTPIEEIVVGIFEEVLKLNRVGRRENFFELGGHSLLATQVISRVRKMLGVEIGVRSIFERATAEGLAQGIEEAMRAGEKAPAPPLVRIDRGQRDAQKVVRMPLSFAQQRLWFIDQLNPGSALYNVTDAVRLEGDLNLNVLERVINEIVRRHEALRTRFEVDAGEPEQVIDDWEPRRLEVADLTSLTPEEREVEITRRGREEAEMGFDLNRGPLLRVRVLKLADDEHVALYTMHHIVSDAWSMEILIREVRALYQAYSAGSIQEVYSLPELPIQYADFAVWQREWLKGEVLEEKLEYWRKQLVGMEDLELPTDHPRPATRSYRGASRQFVVERAVAEKLRELSQREGVTLFMTLLGGFDVLMSRYSGQEDVTIGTDIANRNRAEIEGLIGFFVNQLVLRVEVRTEESSRLLLKRVRETCLGAYAHQDLPFEKLVEELRPERDLSRAPLFQVKLISQDVPSERLEGVELRSGSGGGNVPDERLELEGIELRSGSGPTAEVESEAQAVELDLTVSITDEGHELVGVVVYSRDLFEAGTIERLMSHYRNVLRGMAEEGGRPISDLSLLSEAEREQIVVEWNQTRRSYPEGRCIHELFREQAERSPERIALMYEGHQVSYRELNRRANQLGNYLQKIGVGPEVLVGLYLERSVEMVVALMGVLKAGGGYLPLDSAYPLERIAFMLEDAGVGVALTRRKFEERLPAYWGQTVLIDGEWERISEQSEGEPESAVIPENLAYVIYTSGSTGRPKGVIVEHKGLCNLGEVQKDRFRLGAQSRVLQFASLSFDASVWEIFSALSAGGSLHMYEQQSLMLGADLIRILKKDQITTVTLPPTVLAELEEEGLFHLQTVIAAGEASSAGIVERWARGREFFNAYGPTESTVCASMSGCEAGDGAPTIGQPIANMRLYILDREMNPVPVGVRGELCISGIGVARGYLGRPELTAERFTPDIFVGEGGVRLYRTGDLGRYLPDGRIEFIGRADYQVKVRGYRIELGEIGALLNEHPSVKQSVVVAREDERGGKRLIGYVVGEGEVSEVELKKYLRERAPEYMAPEAILALEEMPLTANGKIDRKRLPMLDGVGREVWREDVGRRTPVEEIVGGIFEEVLKVDRVGRAENFFEIGGHSLLATRVISRVRTAFGVEIGLGSIFEDPTVGGMARRIEEALKSGERDEAPPLVKVKREGQGGVRLPLSFAQQRLWFLDQLVPNNPFYNIPGAVRLEGELDLAVLERVINEIIRRHEVLRTRFEVEEGEPAQVIDEWEPRRLERADLTNLPLEEREEEARRIAREDAETGFDLSSGPLLRVRVLKLEEEEHVVLYTMHHIVSDEWSMRILAREVEALYGAFSAGEPSPLPELQIQYADFAVWQWNWFQGEVLERQLRYWGEQLAGLEPLELPLDHLRPALASYRGASLSFELSEKLTLELQSLSRREGVTLFMTLLACFQTLLARCSGQWDIAVGAPIANRTRMEIEALIGFFANTLVLRTQIEGGMNFRELLGQAREVCLGAYAHQDLPFEKLVGHLQPERNLSRHPLFQVMLVLQDAPSRRLESSGPGASDLATSDQTSKFDLTLTVGESADRLDCDINYNSDLFEAETVSRLAERFKTFVKSLVADPQRRLSDLELLPPDERRQILFEWNQTAVTFAQSGCVHQLFKAQATRRPEAVAVAFGDEQVSYGELERRANRLANHLRAGGVGIESRVGVCLNRSVEMVVAVLGVLKAGGAYLPLDPEYPMERLGHMLEDAEVGVALTQYGLKERLPAYVGRTVCLNEEWERISNESEDDPGVEVDGANPAYVIYTSGSTGRPKGVMIQHRSVVNLAAALHKAVYVDCGESLRVTLNAPLSFDASVKQLVQLLFGHTLCVLPEELRIDARELLSYLRHHAIDVLDCTPSQLRSLMDVGLTRDSHSSPKVALVGGEAIDDAMWSALSASQPTGFYNVYGPTECTVDSAVCRVSDEIAKPTIGRPVANAQIYLLNTQLRPAPIGAPAELYISGHGLARGYLNSPELTAERFMPNPFSQQPGERLYRTGDLGRYLTDGNIEFIGRADEQVKIRGYRVELGEIERALRQQAGISDVAVVAREAEHGDKRLVAYVVAEPGTDPNFGELRSALRQCLPDYMVPAEWMKLERLPLTASGKLDRKRLPAPSDARQLSEESYVAPRDALELQLARIWESLLGVHPVGVKDNFFELGGHSLLAVSLMAKIRAAIGRELPLSSLFQGATVESLASMLRQEASSMSWSCLVELQASGSQPPLFFAHPAGGVALCYLDLARCLGSDQPFYGFQTPGLYGERDYFTSIEAMASHYIEAMRTVQPEGPYFLGGWSLGCIIAYEMAQQLVAQGQKVSQLLLLDCGAWAHRIDGQFQEQEQEQDMEDDDAELLMSIFAEALPIAGEELEPLKGDERLDYVLKRARSKNILPPDIDVPRARAFLKLYKTNNRAMSKYIAQVYPGTVTLFKTAKNIEIPSSGDAALSEEMLKIIKMEQDPTMGWGGLAASGVRVIDVPGNHQTMVNRPHVETLALKIKDCLNETETTAGKFDEEMVGSPGNFGLNVP